MEEAMNVSSEEGNGTLAPFVRLSSLEDPLILAQISVLALACGLGILSHLVLIGYTLSSFGKHIECDHLFIYILSLQAGAAAQIAFGAIHASRLYFGTWLLGSTLCSAAPTIELMGFYFRSASVCALAFEMGNLLPRFGSHWPRLRALALTAASLLLWLALDSSLYQFDLEVQEVKVGGAVDCVFAFPQPKAPILETYKFLWESLHLGLFVFLLVAALLLLALYHILPESFAGVEDLVRPASALAVCQLLGMSPGNAFSVWIRTKTRAEALVKGWNTGCVIFAYLAVIAEIPILAALIHRLRSRKWILLLPPGSNRNSTATATAANGGRTGSAISERFAVQ